MFPMIKYPIIRHVLYGENFTWVLVLYFTHSVGRQNKIGPLKQSGIRGFVSDMYILARPDLGQFFEPDVFSGKCIDCLIFVYKISAPLLHEKPKSLPTVVKLTSGKSVMNGLGISKSLAESDQFCRELIFPYFLYHKHSGLRVISGPQFQCFLNSERNNSYVH